ncbi:hypothetical protein SAMN05192558_11832 [Actinokineospora alba]|uniref:Uncharacterized protein n=1 Tax=Actinokineospora alba TaxID=504798 RepID=A0A1H0W7V1_9PSEU|nr:DUF5682 family protein [Actinokineospora alba]TDP70022.1 hypothetical protein C8E96_5622 [Actinokineospora alba]SDJ49735.1 hypothetical protein SAMN05421871_11732 [Actinokineospora alba]SDP86366.1 hypothetical protein SAMN05192558_11832 [Actinokineospora alba]
MTEAVTLLGIRHHGPGSARAVVRALADLAPDLVLIEGPPEADALVSWAADDTMVPPVALLAYAADDAARAAFWPFAVFSPEWQAIRYAVEAGVPVRFCDLPAAHQFAAEPTRCRGRTEDPLGTLAQLAGYDDAERWWDEMIEHGRHGEPPFEVIAEAMGALREEHQDTDERERQREAYMRQVIRKSQKDGHERIAVVCGAWHVPALRQPFPPAAHDQRILKGLPKRKVACTWVPWTHSRLATTSGYGAGITSPGWYHHLFTATDHITARWLTDVARVLRTEDLPVSSAHVIEAVRLADTLAALRGRAVAGLSEVTEATRAVLCGGDELQLDLVTRRLVVGERLGEVPEGTPQAPVAADLTAQARRLRLKRDPQERELDLDLRDTNGAERSKLLHRLRVLGIDWGVPAISARRSKGTFRETWSLAWEPAFEVDLVAAGVHGTSVVAAATSVVRSRTTAESSLPEITGAIEDCLLADLADALPEALAALDTRAAADADAAALMGALPPLARAARYGDVRGTDTAALTAVSERILTRVCAGLPRAAHGLDDQAAEELCALVDGVHEATGLLGETATGQWLDALAAVAARDSAPPLLAGRVTRLLHDADRVATGEVALRLGRELTAGVAPAAAAAYIEGFFAGGALLLIHDDTLLDVLDRWLAGIAGDQFAQVLPLLRRTFGAFAGPERRTIGERAARRGSGVPEVVAEIDEERAAAAVPVLATLLGVR